MKKALVLSLALVLGLGFAAFTQGELSGSWKADVTIDPAAADIAGFFAFESVLEITYSVGGWDFSSYSKMTDLGWIEQSFEANGSFGAFTIESGMVFDTVGLFTSMYVDTSFTFGSVALGFEFDLVPNDLSLCITGEATTGLVDITIAMCFGAEGEGCDLDWQGVDIYVDFPFCCADVSAVLNIGCAGFEQICFSVDGIVVANIPWFTLGADLCFTLESKTLTLSPAFDFGADVCFDVYLDVASGDAVGPLEVLTIGDITISGIGLTCEIGGVSFTGISYWGTGTKPGILKGTPYWEAYQIATSEEGCCGPLDFDVAIFFDVASTYLFDVAAFDANIAYELGENFIFSMGLDYTAAAGLTLWTIGFEVIW